MRKRSSSTAVEKTFLTSYIMGSDKRSAGHALLEFLLSHSRGLDLIRPPSCPLVSEFGSQTPLTPISIMSQQETPPCPSAAASTTARMMSSRLLLLPQT
nr:unnamed protein product [Spirometra erinaceieuropaei]